MAAKDITPDKQSVESCLKQKTYYVDFYQREYVWKRETVEILLQDIFYAFELSYAQFKGYDLSPKTIGLYNWYYLNVFITNEEDGKVYIVDGQQRLTTLTLIATKLFHLTNNANLKDALKDCIYAKDKYSGEIFCLDNDKRKDVMQSILHEEDYTLPFKNATEENLVGRYKDISRYFDNKALDERKLDTFISYFLDRIVLVELSINKDDTPMVFEVINDRGEDLKPFEILKGKLIGMLNKGESDAYSIKWDQALSQIQGHQDDFFRDYLKAKFVHKSNASVETPINGLYHRYIFENNDIAQHLEFRRSDINNIDNIKKFINIELPYYTGLYAKVSRKQNEYLKYCSDINGFNTHVQNILAACTINDIREDEKIAIIAKETDRLWMLLILNNVYNSNDFQTYIYRLNHDLRDADISEYRSYYDAILRDAIAKRRNIESSTETQIPLLDYSQFSKRAYGDLSQHFLRYFFARIEQYICEQSNTHMQNDVMSVSTKTGPTNGYHIEHILSINDENKSYFIDEDDFNAKRNLLGGLLLLKGKNNLSSSNELFVDKLKTYSNGFILGHSLCEDFYHANKDFDSFNERLLKQTGVNFKPYSTFDENALTDRSKLIYELTKLIWEV